MAQQKSKIRLLLTIGIILGTASILFWLRHRLYSPSTVPISPDDRASPEHAATPAPSASGDKPKPGNRMPSIRRTPAAVDQTPDGSLLDRANKRLPGIQAGRRSVDRSRPVVAPKSKTLNVTPTPIKRDESLDHRRFICPGKPC